MIQKLRMLFRNILFALPSTVGFIIVVSMFFNTAQTILISIIFFVLNVSISVINETINDLKKKFDQMQTDYVWLKDQIEKSSRNQ